MHALRTEVRELGHAQTLAQVAKALLALHQRLFSTAQLHGIALAQLCQEDNVKEALLKQAGENKKIINAKMPGWRYRSSAVKHAILEYAKGKKEFSVDDLVRDLPEFKSKRQSLVSNLLFLSSRGDKPLRQTGPGVLGRSGSPATYTLRNR